jgi:hypothetical protein
MMRAIGEGTIMHAVLRDARASLARWRRVGGRRPEAYAWVESRDRSWAYSFERVCEALGVDATALRRELLDTARRRHDIGNIVRAWRRLARWWNDGRGVMRRLQGGSR